MILLTSNALSSPALLNAARSALPADAIKAVIVVTADKRFKKKNRSIPLLTEQLEALGLTVDLLDIDKEAPQLLLDYDVIELMGGNPFYLMHSIRRHEAESVMAQLAQEKLLIGSSAGAIVLGPTLELIQHILPDLNKGWRKDLDGLGLCACCMLPHNRRFLDSIQQLDEICKTFEAERSIAVLRLEDGEGSLIGRDFYQEIRI